ncbi:VirB4 family type IV secretion system protein [Ktedonobacter racemifer]|uniref:Type IV secretory pathway VirB4 protein n=1 Tax=Ktedonobacter racemifer DSM 44963 TaxID=485913 RepID=D6U8U8_KTERA|nr:ATP-binding protein [Ktedonobacter racemifer]EFH79658.1 Type IV secretory pathway VirB4 protein [Ktedonobacter racemifer DSM 44963]
MVVDLRKHKHVSPKLGKVLDLIGVREIEHGCLCLKTAGPAYDREYKAVVAVDPLNFTLLSDKEKEAVLESFRVLLNRLTFAISIHIRIERYDIDPYLSRLDLAAQNARTPAIGEMAVDHKEFVLTLAATHTLLQRRFYIIVPSDHEKAKSAKKQPDACSQARSQLSLRCNDIIADLDRAGLTSHRLDNVELAHYYQSCVHAGQARDFPLAGSNLAAVARPIKPTAAAVALAGLPAAGDLDINLDATISARPDENILQQDVNNTAETHTIAAATVTNEGNKGKPARARTTATATTDTPEKAPDRFVNAAELVAPTGLHVAPDCLTVRHNVGNEFLRAFTLIGYPAEVEAGWFDRLVQIEEPDVDLIVYIAPQEAGPFVSHLSRRLTTLRGTQLAEQHHGKTPDPYIEAARTDIEDLRKKLVNRSEQAFEVSTYILVRGTNKLQLAEKSARLLSLLKSLELTAVDLTYEHHRAWQCGLPDGRDILKRKKILDTSSLMMGFPFSSTNLSTPTGILTGIMPNGSLVILDPLSDLLENGHEVKFARSGAGKSFDEKVRVGRYILAGFDALVIDPENEYKALCEQYDGVNIRMSTGNYQLNPFDLPGADADDRNVLEEKFQSLLALFDLLIADKTPGVLSQREKAYLTRCLHLTYHKAGITADRSTHVNRPPNMTDFYNVLRSGECGEDSYELADRLQRFVPSFPDQTRLDTNRPLTVFNIRDLDSESRPAALLLITDYVWTLVRRSRKYHPRLLVIDEAWSLLQFEEGGRFLASMARRARKYNLCLRIISQDVEDCLSSEAGRTILVNASMKFLMKQDSSTIDAVTQAFHLSDEERKYLLSCAKGSGLFFARSSHVPLRVVASPVEYKLATTNPNESEEDTEHDKDSTAVALPVINVATRTTEYDVVMPNFFAAAPGADTGATPPSGYRKLRLERPGRATDH